MKTAVAKIIKNQKICFQMLKHRTTINRKKKKFEVSSVKKNQVFQILSY